MKKFHEVLIELASVQGIWINQRLIYDNEGNVVGRIEIQYYAEHSVFINLIAIYPEYRNRGYFDELVELIARASDINGDTVQLIPLSTETDEIPTSDMPLSKLKSVYSRHGFVADIEDIEVSNFTRYPLEKTNDDQ